MKSTFYVVHTKLKAIFVLVIFKSQKYIATKKFKMYCNVKCILNLNIAKDKILKLNKFIVCKLV